MNELQESFKRLKYALEHEYATIPIKDYQTMLQELAELKQRVKALEAKLAEMEGDNK